MAEQLVHFFKEHLPAELIILIISMLPILELRGGMVAAALLGVDFSVAFPLCVIGNMLPIPLILLFIRKIFNWLKKKEKFKNFVENIENRAKKKAGKSIHKYKLWGLFLFVAIPLPGTGGWTGALVADFMDIRIKHAFPVMTIGVITAGIIMSILTYFIPSLFF